jgi:hypothetical protein
LTGYEDSLRADMNRVLAGRGFDFDRDVIAVYLYRWGHSMVYPKPGWPFSAPIVGSNGQVRRVPSARFYARQQIGRISFLRPGRAGVALGDQAQDEASLMSS